MPFTDNSQYRPPYLLRSAHLQTILPHYLKKNIKANIIKERLELEDGDFLDLDWQKNDKNRLAIITHGLEGNSRRYYVKSFSAILQEAGFDTLAWNMRSCSREMNRLPRLYHSGETSDLLRIIKRAEKDNYQEIVLVGISIGGNITLKLLGELGSNYPSSIKAALTLSVPCDLKSSAYKMAKFSNKFYLNYFIKSLKQKIIEKHKQYPDLLDLKGLEKIKTFKEFDEAYTAPLHGFQNADHYWNDSSSLHYIPKIKVPSMLISSKDDPFLSPTCFPIEQAKANDNFHFELSQHGGHIAFIDSWRNFSNWGEGYGLGFLLKNL